MIPSPRAGHLALCFASLVALAAAAAGAESASPLGSLPATFVGTVPCADCSGIRYQIDLLPRSAFVQRTTYLRSGMDVSNYTLGSWKLSADGRTMVLDGGRGNVGYWAIADARTLRKLDTQGEPIASTLPYELRRTTGVTPVEPRLQMQGMFSTPADAPRFRECRSRLEWPVARTDDYPSLERAFGEKRTSPGAQLHVTLEARVERRTGAGGERTQATLVVERFVRVQPADSCATEAVQGELANTRWVPVRIGPRSITGLEHEPWFVLEPRTKQVTGSGGCNKFTGSYASGEGSLTFGPLAATRMSCAGMETETAFLKALADTRRFRLAGRHLELDDAHGVELLRLEERNLK
jgi:copper homeostasis protein (lipoprotein)